MTMPDQEDKCPFYREYDLASARKITTQSPAPHQAEALQKLDRWYASKHDDQAGGILVLPTGGGKTFTAVHFLCRHPLSKGGKVLWLAHTHHLLEQAFVAFEQAIPLIAEPITHANIRVVSGTVGHFRPADIERSDDVLVCSLQTACRALKKAHPKLINFLDEAGEELFVVFDEAHHAPAPSYRKLLTDIQERCPKLKLLGLTATPTYSDERRQGWLRRLFPQGIVAQQDPHSLMAAGILSRPVFEEAQTPTEPAFDEREYQNWIGTHRDLPEGIIHKLATDQERNDCIVAHYLTDPEKYGKTIIFADRWYQCDYFREALDKRGVRADVVYSHVAADPGSAEARNKRKVVENAKVLKKFREGKLDVLINVRMLTEGTDVPDVQSVFLTRQTTSRILLTQMIGRGLRGPKFGGTEKAIIVSFIDNWKQRVNWATYDQLAEGLADDTIPEYGKRPPLQLISIDLVRHLARQMDSGININPGPYKTFLPVGWYRVEYEVAVEDTDDVEPVTQLVMVFEGQKTCFEEFLNTLEAEDLNEFEDAEVRKPDVKEVLTNWQNNLFDSSDEHIGSDLLDELLAIARHMAQNENARPPFFQFEARDQHNLDAIAHDFIDNDFGPRQVDQALHVEYTKEDRYWRVLYYHYDLFKSHYDACVNRILHARRHGEEPDDHRPVFTTPQALPEAEASDETKREVKAGDHHQCLCCGNHKNLQVDHISPRYPHVDHRSGNLQTLCKICNGLKGDTEVISFRNHETTLTSSPSSFPEFKTPKGKNAKDAAKGEMYLRRCVNFYYRCAAVEKVDIGGRGERFRTWRIWLFQGNDPEWLEPHLPGLAKRIRKTKEKERLRPAPDQIEIVG